MQLLSDVTSSVVKQNAYLQEKIENLQKSIGTTNMLLAKSGGILTTDLAKFNVQENDKKESEELTKSKKTEILAEAALSGKLSDLDVIKFENSGVLTPEAKSYLESKEN